MADEHDTNDNQTQNEAGENNQNQSSNADKTPTESGDPGRTPGSAEGDEETIAADIKEKEAEGKL